MNSQKGAARRQRPGQAFPAALLLVCALAGCGAPAAYRSAGSSPSAGSSSSASASRSVSAFRRSFFNPQVTVTGGGVYLAWQPSGRPGSLPARTELARIDPRTGVMRARQHLGAAVGEVVTADGWLWASAVSAGERLLLKLNPATLAVAGRWRMGPDRSQGWEGNVLAVAGGWLWLAVGGRLIRVSLPGARVTATLTLPAAATSDVSANAAGSQLLVGEAGMNGRGAVQRRDPATGKLLASHPVLGVVAPIVAGPVGSSVWISEPTGMMGYVQRLDATTLRPSGGGCSLGKSVSTCVEGSNGITARLANGLLWVTQALGGGAFNYCAEPSTGRKLAPLGTPGQAYILAVGSRSVFYASAGPRGADLIRQQPLPAACMAR